MSKQLKLHRAHLVHVVPDLSMSGILSFVVELGLALKREYRHTLLYETPPLAVDENALFILQAAGIEALQIDRITPEVLQSGNYTGAILYNVTDHPWLGEAIPSVYYSYGILDSTTKADVYVAASKYAAVNRSYGPDDPRVVENEFIVPPAISSRTLGRMATPSRPDNFMLGILTSGYQDKYPCKTVIRLLNELPKDVGIILTELPKYRHPGVVTAIERRKKMTKLFWPVPMKPGVSPHYILKLDAVLCATAENMTEPGGRLATEAMTMSKAVIAERSGVYPELIDDKVNGILYDTVDEIIDHIDRLKQSEGELKKLGVNARLRASWQDIAVHLLRFKSTLRMIGA